MSYPVCHSGLGPESSFFLDSRSPPSRGQVYRCESRGGNESVDCRSDTPFAAINVAVSQSKKVALIVWNL